VPQNWQLRFDDLSIKITAMVSWLGSQNQANYGLSIASQNQQEGDGVGHVSRSSGLLHVESSLTRVSQSDLKTSGDATADGARGTITDVVSELN
jgi:hypothetical protein